MSTFKDELKERANKMTKAEVLRGLEYVANIFLPLPDDVYSALFKAIDIVKSVDEKTMKCRCEEQSGKATMYHKEFVDDLKAQIASKDDEISSLSSQLAVSQMKVLEAKELTSKLKKLIGD